MWAHSTSQTAARHRRLHPNQLRSPLTSPQLDLAGHRFSPVVGHGGGATPVVRRQKRGRRKIRHHMCCPVPDLVPRVDEEEVAVDLLKRRRTTHRIQAHGSPGRRWRQIRSSLVVRRWRGACCPPRAASWIGGPPGTRGSVAWRSGRQGRRGWWRGVWAGGGGEERGRRRDEGFRLLFVSRGKDDGLMGCSVANGSYSGG